MFLSVCILTKNEASNIKSCLDSVKDIADEVIILDSFSTDETVAIAKNYTSKIYFKEWIDDFSFSRNFTISKATGAWILIIDADETFSYQSNFLDRLKTTQTKAFSLVRKEIYRQQHDSKQVKYPVSIIRLFKRETNARFQYAIHERLDDFFVNKGIPVSIQQDCFLAHHISTQPTHVLAKQEKYLKLINSSLEENPKDEWLNYQKIKTLKFFKRNDQVLACIEKFTPSNTKINIATQVILSQVYIESGKFEDAIRLLKSLPKPKNCSLVNMLIGDTYYLQKKFVHAVTYYSKLKTSSKSINFKQAMYIMSYCEKEDKVYKIASVLYALKLYVACILYLDVHKKHLQADSLLLYALIFLKKDDPKQALKFIKKARMKDPFWQKLIDLEQRYT